MYFLFMLATPADQRLLEIVASGIVLEAKVDGHTFRQQHMRKDTAGVPSVPARGQPLFKLGIMIHEATFRNLYS